ncbi:MAG: alpha/beta hydrolase [Bacteroidota bacterium]
MQPTLIVIALCFSLTLSGQAPDSVIALYPEGIPCANALELQIDDQGDIGRKFSQVHEPQLYYFAPDPDLAQATAVVIAPGGGYWIQAWDWEGVAIAERFNAAGIHAFVLKYRLPAWETGPCKSQVALMDGQRAMQYVRAMATDYGIAPNKIGIMGFSAGGHLAASVSVHHRMASDREDISYAAVSSRPDFSILIYPVIDMADSTSGHRGSRNALLGNEAPFDEAVYRSIPAVPYTVYPEGTDLRKYYSPHLMVNTATPPAYLVHAFDDEGVPISNSVSYLEALKSQGENRAVLATFEEGGHGFGLSGRGERVFSEDLPKWFDKMLEWLVEMSFSQ